jgi:hypothetical protein
MVAKTSFQSLLESHKLGEAISIARRITSASDSL